MTVHALVLALWAQDEDRSHPQVYDRILPSVVAVRAKATLGERSGTGIILDSDGLVLVSYSVVPEGSINIRVYQHGPRMYKAEIVATSQKDEVTLLRIKTDRKLKPAPLGSSAKVKVGQISYTIGNAYNSFIIDDQPAFNMGIVSGYYNLKEAKENSHYVGYVFETTAAVNWGMEGAPMLNAEGEVVAMITLNYSSSRWLGNGIPIDFLKTRIRKLQEEARTAEPTEDPEVEGTLGLTVTLESGKVVVASVDDKGPAASLGLQKGDVVESIGGKTIRSVEDFRSVIRGLKAGAVVWIRVRAMGESQLVKIEVAAKQKK
jgi:S1-C subfamily serine protease